MKKTIDFFKSNTRLIAFIAVVATLSLLACSSSSDDEPTPSAPSPIPYSGTFVKSDVNVVSTATGNLTSTLNPTTRVLTYTFSWSNLTGNPTQMHFHDSGPVIIEITGFANAASGTYSGTATFTAEQIVDLDAGKIYVQIHSPNFPGGEILAAVLKSGGNPAPGTPGY